MLATISILTAFAFAAMYPLCFLISADDPLKNSFHKFHIGLPNTVGGVVLVFVWFMDLPLELKIIVTAWKVIFLSISWFSWKKEYPSPGLMAIPCFIGIYAFLRTQAYMVAADGRAMAFVGVLAGLIFCASLYGMNLGHWYLNVHGIPLTHLMRAIQILQALLWTRLGWNAVSLGAGKLYFRGDQIPIIEFIMTSEGFLVLLGIFFGVIFPLVSTYFAREVLKLRNTQSATGILYVILCSVILGDLSYKYYWIKYGVIL